MKIIQKLLRYPTIQLILHGVTKAIVIAPLASVLFASFVMYELYGPTFDMNYHFFGTASEFFIFASIFTVISSIPVSLIMIILLAIFLKLEFIKQRLSYVRSFIIGLLFGGIVGYVEGLIVAHPLGDSLIYAVVAIIAGLASGLGGLWMTKDALKLFPHNFERDISISLTTKNSS